MWRVKWREIHIWRKREGARERAREERGAKKQRSSAKRLSDKKTIMWNKILCISRNNELMHGLVLLWQPRPDNNANIFRFVRLPNTIIYIDARRKHIFHSSAHKSNLNQSEWCMVVVRVRAAECAATNGKRLEESTQMNHVHRSHRRLQSPMCKSCRIDCNPTRQSAVCCCVCASEPGLHEFIGRC